MYKSRTGKRFKVFGILSVTMLVTCFTTGCDTKVFPDAPATCIPKKEKYTGDTAICSINAPISKERCEKEGSSTYHEVSGLEGLLLCEEAGFYFSPEERKKAINEEITSSFKHNWKIE